MVPTRRLWILVALAAFLSLAGPALAHGYIVRAIPDDRATLEHAPARLQYWFSEPLEPNFSSLTVRDQAGNVIATGAVDPKNNTLMTARLPTNLPDGAYIVDLRPAFASDGHVVAESQVFFVGKEIGGVTGSEASTDAVPLEVVWRVLVLASTMLLFGTFTLYSLVLLPAWGSRQYRAGFLPPRVMNRLNWIVIFALVLAVAGNALALIQQSMAFFSADVGQVIAQGLWTVVRAGSRFGDVWNLRMMILALVAALHFTGMYLRGSQPETVRAFWAANAWLMALFVSTLSLASHASGELMWAWLGIVMDWLHAASVALWVGGLAALVLVLPVALRPYDSNTRQQALAAVMRRFSRLAVACVFLVITTGIYTALTLFYTPADLTQTTYGHALVLKGLLIALLLVVAALHHAALHPELVGTIKQRLRFLPSGLLDRLVGRAAKFAMTLRLEVVLTVVVLASVGLLSATPVPEPDFISDSVETPSATQTVGDLTISQTISPGGPGINTYDTTVEQNNQPVDGLSVTVQTVSPSRDFRSPWEPLEPAGDGLYVTASDQLDQAGDWLTLVDVSAPDGSTTRAAFQWTISDSASIVETRTPGLLHYLAVLGVLLAIGWALYPAARRVFGKLDFNPFNVVVAIVVTALTIGMMVFTVLVLQQQESQYQDILYPPPTVVNTVLPDSGSLARGQALFADHCPNWQADSADFPVLQDGLGIMRDGELFAAVRDGWRGLQPCDSGLNESQRWDIVNYIRTFARSS